MRWARADGKELEPTGFSAADATAGAYQQNQAGGHYQKEAKGEWGNADREVDVVSPTGAAMFDASGGARSCSALGIEDL